ncbi:MAG: S8 family serine peptidase, partial [Chloroflexi bacterium]|nr:S8 family serine peptidase [Chloroflexota bacterium]
MLLVITLILSLLAFVPLRSPLKAHPMLLQWAVERPTEIVRVIVQKYTNDDSVEAMVLRQGGAITQDLSIIRAFAADLPASAVPQLAQAPGVKWISPDAEVAQSDAAISTANLLDSYVSAIGADSLWNDAHAIRGQGVTVAIVDSGIALHPDLTDLHSRSLRVVANVDFSGERRVLGRDGYGHGTHIAGIVGGNGLFSLGARMGVAPGVNLVNVRVCDSSGKGMTSNVVAGLQWVYENRDRYNIRVLNLSLNSSVPESYHTSPLAAALEVLWFNGVVVVVSAGNNGSGEENGILYPPA